MKRLVLDGVGLCLLTELDVYEEVKEGKLRFIPISGPRLSTSLSLSCRDPRALTEIGKAMSEIIVSRMAALENLSAETF